MKDLENIDDLFGSSLENYEVTPPLDAKLAIEKELSKRSIKKNNRKKGGWLLLAITSISIMATAMFVQQKSKQTVSESKLNKNNLIAINKTKVNHNQIANEISPSLKSNNKDNRSNKDIVNAKLIGSSASISKVQITETKKSNSSFHSNTNRNAISQNSVFWASNEKAANTELNPSKLNIEETENISELNGNNVLEINAEGTIDNTTLTAANKENVTVEHDALDADSAIIDFSPTANMAEKISPNPKTKSVFISMHVGSGLNMNHFYKNNSISKQELKDSIYFNRPYMSVHVLGGLQFNQISVSTGFSFNELYEKVAYSQVGQRKTQILVDSIYINPITHDTIVKHNVPVDTTLNYYTKNEVQNRYSILQIPILISYKIIIGTNLELDLSSGGSFNLLLNSKGNYKLSSQGTLNDDQSQQQKPYKTYSFSAMAMIGLGYHIHEKLTLQMALPLQIGLNNFNKNEYFIRRSINSVGLQVGLKYHFN